MCKLRKSCKGLPSTKTHFIYYLLIFEEVEVTVDLDFKDFNGFSPSLISVILIITYYLIHQPTLLVGNLVTASVQPQPHAQIHSDFYNPTAFNLSILCVFSEYSMCHMTPKT